MGIANPSSEPEKRFDTRTHILDGKTGEVIKTQHYAKTMTKGGHEYYVRDGVKYCANGDPWDDVHACQPAQPVAKEEAVQKPKATEPTPSKKVKETKIVGEGRASDASPDLSAALDGI